MFVYCVSYLAENRKRKESDLSFLETGQELTGNRFLAAKISRYTPQDIIQFPITSLLQVVVGFDFSTCHCTFCTFSEYCSENRVLLHHHHVLITKYCARTVIILHSILASLPLPLLPIPPYLDPAPFLSCVSGMYPAWHTVGNLVLAYIFKFGFDVTVQGMPVSLQGVVLMWCCFVCLVCTSCSLFGFLLYEIGAVIAGICMFSDYCHLRK